MITREDGPFEVFLRLRSAIHVSEAPEWVREGMECPLCVSFWLSFLVSPYLRPKNPYQYVLLSLAVSAVTVVITKFENEEE